MTEIVEFRAGILLKGADDMTEAEQREAIKERVDGLESIQIEGVIK